MTTWRWLQRCVPENNPFPWIILNALCFGSSFFLLLVSLYAEGESSFRMFAKECYLHYNFATTLVWCVQISLKAWWSHEQLGVESSQEEFNKKHSRIMLLLELAVAVYFFMDSAVVLYKYKIKKQDIDDILIDVGIGSVAYCYEFVETIREWRALRTTSQNNSQYEPL